MEQCSPLLLHRRRLSSAFQARLWLLLASRWRGKDFSVASPCFLGRPIKLWSRRCSSFFALCFSRRCRSSPVSPHRRTSAHAIAAKHVLAPSYPCASSRPTNSASPGRKLELHRLLPRGRQLLRRARFVAARAPRCISVPGFG